MPQPNLEAFRFPRFAELPDMGLYLEQLLQLNNGILQPFFTRGQPAATSAMVSNYITAGVLAPPERKRYGREHLCRLLVLSLLKESFTIQEICLLFQVQKETYPLPVSYDYFCQDFENALSEAFCPTGLPLPDHATRQTPQTRLLRAMVLATVSRIYINCQLFWRQP